MSAVEPTTVHVNRIRGELKDAGISHLAMLRFTCRYLPRIIHNQEHIKAAVFGHRKTGEGVLNFTEGILVATDRRVIYLDHKPGFTTTDEIAYDVISGVNVTKTGPFSSVTLFTKLGNYTISFAKPVSVQRFADYIETYRVTNPYPQRLPSIQGTIQAHTGALDFLAQHDTAVLSTIGRSGSVTGAVVYYVLLNSAIYILTRDATRKARNIYTNSQVALTIFDAPQLQELQVEATAQVETEVPIKEKVVSMILPPVYTGEAKELPPVAKVQSGAFVIFRLTPTSYAFSDFRS